MLPLLTQGGGAEKYFMSLANWFNGNKKSSIRVDVVTLDQKSFASFARLIHIFYHLNFFGKIDISGREKESSLYKKFKNLSWIKVSFGNLRKTLRGYDLIYSKNEIVELFTLKLIGYQKLPPIIVGVHTPVYYPKAESIYSKIHNWLYSGLFYKWLLKGVRSIHVSNRNDEKLMKEISRVPVRLIFYPFEKIKVRSLPADKIDKTKRLNVLFIGRISEQKGVDIFLKIIKRINQTRKGTVNFSFKIVGSGDKKMTCQLISFAQKQRNVRYLGHIAHERVNSFYQWADVVVVPSRYEVSPYVVLEAGANGRIVIAADIPGPRDIIQDGKTGFLVPMKVENFAQKLKEMYYLKQENYKEFVQIGENARKYIRQKFNQSKVFSQLEEMMK